MCLNEVWIVDDRDEVGVFRVDQDARWPIRVVAHPELGKRFIFDISVFRVVDLVDLTDQ